MPKSSRALLSWLLATSLPLVAGCTHQDPATRSVEKLRADIAKIEADRDRLDQRVGALEAAEQRRRAALESPAPAASAPARPLPVVRVADAAGRPAALPAAHGEAPDIDTDSADRRPLVHANGSRGSTERRGSKDNGDDALAYSPEAKRDYDGALALTRGKQYEKALQSFTAFLVRYPDHAYAENAMFWRGECFYATGAFARAVEQFEGLIARFPYGNKAADALLKLGLAREKTGTNSAPMRNP